MRRFFKQLIRILQYWFYWTLDYVYVGFWQFLGLFRRTDIRDFLQSSWDVRKEQIILLPGIYERWEFMKPVAKALLAKGYSVHVIEGLGYNTKSVEDAAKLIEQYVVSSSLKNCVIVAHSKGGLIGKYVLSFSKERHRFAGMVAINVPFGGSAYAYWFPFASVRIFAPTSPLLCLLARDKEVNRRIYSIYGLFDPHIPGGSYLNGATNVQLSTFGHFRIIHDQGVHTEVVKAVDKLTSK